MGGFASRSRAGRVSAGGIVACCAIVVVTVLLVAPMFMRVRKIDGGPDCQSNLKQIGSAIKMYLGEWHDSYPTQRVLLRNGKPGRIVSHIKLTPVGDLRPDGTQVRYHYGVNWVEALFPYMESISKDSSGAWACHAVGKEKYPKDSNTAAVSYAFNRNLIECAEEVPYPENTMMVREMDRRVDAELRPTNDSCGLPDVPPDSPFLTKRDSRIGRTNPEQHGKGSNLLFADGHVRGFYGFRNPEYLAAKRCWCAKAKLRDSWDQPGHYKSIRITP